MSKVTLSQEDRVKFGQYTLAGPDRQQYADNLCADIEAWGAALVQQARAEAWDEGHDDCRCSCSHGGFNGYTCPACSNPYRLAAEFDPHASGDKNGDEG